MTPRTLTALAMIAGLMSAHALAAPKKNTASARERAETRSLNQQALAAANGRGAMNNGSMNNGSMSNGSMSNGSMSNGSMNNGSMNNGSMGDTPGTRAGQMPGNMMPGSSSGDMPGMNPPTTGRSERPGRQDMPSQSSTPQTDMPDSSTMPPKG